jgi:hypothetical protein
VQLVRTIQADFNKTPPLPDHLLQQQQQQHQ